MSKKTNWFEERELPNIENDLDLLKAFSIVKNRFNGNPHCYTRNDYILFINTIYAAFRDLYESTHLQKDITTDINVGFVNKGTVLEKGTSLQKIMEMIFVGNGEEPDPEPPVVEENFIYTNIVNPVGKEYLYMQNGLVLNSGLKEYEEFITLGPHDISVMNSINSDSWAYLSFAYIDEYIIETYKPIETIIKKIELHTTNLNWLLATDVNWQNLGVLDWFKLVNQEQIDGKTKYTYKVITDPSIKPGIDLLSMDNLIKFIF